MNKNTTLKQEWRIFKAICPKSILKKVKGRNTETWEYYSIKHAVFFLGFHEISDEMLEKAPTKFAKLRASQRKKGIDTTNSEEINYICSLILNEIKSPFLKELFESSVEYHNKERKLYLQSKKSQ